MSHSPEVTRWLNWAVHQWSRCFIMRQGRRERANLATTLRGRMTAGKHQVPHDALARSSSPVITVTVAEYTQKGHTPRNNKYGAARESSPRGPKRLIARS
jgi:hypothetical protein